MTGGGGPRVELNPKPKKILNFVRPTKIHAQTFGTLKIQCFPSVTVRVPDTMIALSSPLSSGMEVLEFLFDNDFHPGFHREFHLILCHCRKPMSSVSL